MQKDTRVRPLIQEDPTCYRATKQLLTLSPRSRAQNRNKTGAAMSSLNTPAGQPRSQQLGGSPTPHQRSAQPEIKKERKLDRTGDVKRISKREPVLPCVSRIGRWGKALPRGGGGAPVGGGAHRERAHCLGIRSSHWGLEAENYHNRTTVVYLLRHWSLKRGWLHGPCPPAPPDTTEQRNWIKMYTHPPKGPTRPLSIKCQLTPKSSVLKTLVFNKKLQERLARW